MAISAGDKNREVRICMPSWRRFRRDAFRCSLYEAEDVLAEVADVDMICLEPGDGFQWRNRWQARLAFRDLSESLILLNPGLRRVRLTRDYDLFVAVCQSYEDLLYINAIDGWKDRCGITVCWIDEIWACSLHKYRHWLSALNQFDHVFIGLNGSVAPLSEALGRPCQWIPPAVDTVRFTPLPLPVARVIDVFSMGRKSEPNHQALRELAARNEIFYLHDTFAAAEAKVFDHREHRDLLASLSKRSRYFTVARAKMNDNLQTQAQIEFGHRYYEGAAAGAVMIGQVPDCESFRKMFSWQDAVIKTQIDGSDVVEILRSLDFEPERLRELSRRNAVESLLRHDWLYRWQTIFDVAGIKQSSGMITRYERLQKLAKGAHQLPNDYEIAGGIPLTGTDKPQGFATHLTQSSG
jgi:hypothetical protein